MFVDLRHPRNIFGQTTFISFTPALCTQVSQREQMWRKLGLLSVADSVRSFLQEEAVEMVKGLFLIRQSCFDT